MWYFNLAQWARPFSRIMALGMALAMLIIPGCGNDSATPNVPPKPIVVSTIFAYYDAARAIGRNSIDAKILVPPQQSPHEYDPTVNDLVTVAQANLYIKNGMGLDDRFDKLLEKSKAKVLTISKEIPADMLLNTAEVSLGPDTAPAEAVANPHIWLDPEIQIKAAEKIRDALIDIDPSNKSMYEVNAKSYIAELWELNRQFTDDSANFATKEFIGFHSAYAYLARRYGLKQIASIEELPGLDVSPAQAEKIINLIQKDNIKFIAIESALHGKGADLIISTTGVKTMVLEPLETYGSDKDTYISLMTKNLDALKVMLGTSTKFPITSPAGAP